MSNTIGRHCWVIPEGYLPESQGEVDPRYVSHETACILNCSDQEAKISITVYFADREPAGPYRLSVPARRTRHVRFNDLDDPEPVPHDTDYASVIESSTPVVVQHTRLDSRRADIALLSTMAYPVDR
jgi:hypothetical protein